ncbi:MAG TPA: isopentenyl-diphosphate Delta-isomerase [Arthrobacter sp.]|nr:isopentenyl-diphosphate Delta-isomerase [Arthrobacter sp.]
MKTGVEQAAHEMVVLADDDGNSVGTAAKAAVHTAQTPLHLAVSCYVFNEDGRLLVTRRALSKKTWPGVWTNSFCGHPFPAEASVDAVHRRAYEELGIRLRDVELALPDFRYRATDASGVVENEICPVHTAHTSDEPVPNRDEVAEWRWVDTQGFIDAVENAPWAFSPWVGWQLRQLKEVIGARLT